MIYNTQCPHCGSPLTLALHNPDVAPWICSLPRGCGRAWWRAELGDNGRAAWDPHTASHQHDDRLHAERDAELQVHANFGFNVRPSEVASLTDSDKAIVFGRLGVTAADQPVVLGILRQMEDGSLRGQALIDAMTAAGYPQLGVFFVNALGG